MNQQDRIRLLLAVCTACCGVWGCTPTAHEPPVKLVARQRGYFSDVPVPIGFEINETDSVDHLSGQRRVYVHHQYEGYGHPYAVRHFYLDHMPQHKWHMLQASSQEGVQTMHFAKGGESCTITIDRVRLNRVRIGVKIWPEQREPQPPSMKTRP